MRRHHTPNPPGARERPIISIHMGRATARSLRHCHYRLVWTRLVLDDGDIIDRFDQTYTGPTGDVRRSQLERPYHRTADEWFIELVDLYRKITEQADGIPPVGQLLLDVA